MGYCYLDELDTVEGAIRLLLTEYADVPADVFERLMPKSSVLVRIWRRARGA